MPPRRASARRNKSSSKKAPTAVIDHELSAPEVKAETELADDLKVKETEPEMSIPEKVSDPNCDKIEEVILTNPSVGDVNEAMDNDGVAKEELQESEDVEEEEPFEEETTADDNNDQDSDVRKAHNNDVVVVNNGGIKGTTDTVSIQESAQDVNTQTSRENDTAPAVIDDSMLNLDDDDDVSEEDYSEGDDADNDGDEHEVEDQDQDQDQDPSLIVQDLNPDNKKDKGTELYVGKLDKDAVEDDLIRVFQQFGELISTRVVRKPNSKKSKGFGFVRFASVDQATRALSELKDGVEVRGKRAVISASQDNDTLYLGSISKTWTKEQVLQQLKEYGIEHMEVLRLPEDSKTDKKNKGFAFLEFSSHADAVTAFQRLKKPDVVFGRDVSAKVAFAQSAMQGDNEDLSQVNEVHLEGLTKDWDEEKVKDICNAYGEVVQINLCPGKRNKRRDFGFVTFSSSEGALACVKGINSTAFEGESKIRAGIAKTQQRSRIQNQGLRGGFKVEKKSEDSNKKSQSNSLKMKGVLNTQQTKVNKKFPSKNKSLNKGGESSKEAELSKMKGDNDPQQHNRKRKAFSEQKSSARGLDASKKPRNVGQGQNSQTSRHVSKAGNQKRKNPSGNEVRGNRNAQSKKQKGNIPRRERDNFRKPRTDDHSRRRHDDNRNSNSIRYAPTYAASASNAYHVASLPTMRYREMEPHAGYIEPGYAKQSGSYSGYVQPVVRTPHTQHQTVYYEPSSTSHSYQRYIDRPVMTQSRRGYIETAVAPEVQPFRDYRPSANVHIAHDHYDSGIARVVRHDDRGAGVPTYVAGPTYPASQVPNRTTYYQSGGSYGGAYSNRGSYY